MELIVQQVLSGFVRASLLFIVTSGLTLIFGVMGVLNMAHFSFYMLAAYLTWTFWYILTPHPFSFLISTILTSASMIVIGIIIERILIRRLYDRLLTEQLLATFALIYIFSDVVKICWGLEYRYVTRPPILTGSILILGRPFPNSNIFALVLGIVIALSIWFVLHKTKYGRIIRACRSYKEMVGALGISVPLLYTLTFAVSALLAGLGGMTWTIMGTINMGLDHSLLIDAFCVMVIGGLGSFIGTAVASLICGIVYALSIVIEPRLATLLIFIVTGVILTVRPWGLFGKKGMLH